MFGLSRQVITPDAASLIYLLAYLLWIVILFLVIYWFYGILKRIEKTLLEVKKLLEGRPQDPK